MENTKLLFGMGVLMIVLAALVISGCICKGEGEECSNDLECCEGLTCEDVYRDGAQYKECRPKTTENISAGE